MPIFLSEFVLRKRDDRLPGKQRSPTQILTLNRRKYVEIFMDYILEGLGYYEIVDKESIVHLSKRYNIWKLSRYAVT